MRRAAVRRSLVASLLAAVALVALLAGGGPGGPEHALAKAAERTAATGSFRFAVTYGGEEIAGRGHGEVDIDRSRGTFDWSFEDPVSGESFRMQSVYEGNVSWIQLGEFAQVPGAKPWMEMREGSGAVDDFLQPFATPADMLAFLQATSTDIERFGREEVRGVPSERYRGTVDLEKAVAQAVGRRREALQSELDWRRDDGKGTIVEIEVWIDGDGIARRIRFPDGGVGGGPGITLEYYDFGADVVVERPPPAQTMTAFEYAKLVCREDDSDEAAAVCTSQLLVFGD